MSQIKQTGPDKTDMEFRKYLHTVNRFQRAHYNYNYIVMSYQKLYFI
jgi:hypothetical protein